MKRKYTGFKDDDKRKPCITIVRPLKKKGHKKEYEKFIWKNGNYRRKIHNLFVECILKIHLF